MIWNAIKFNAAPVQTKKKNIQSFQETCLANIQGNHHGIHHRLRLFRKEVQYILSTGQKLHGKHKDMCELGDKGSVASRNKV